MGVTKRHGPESRRGPSLECGDWLEGGRRKRILGVRAGMEGEQKEQNQEVQCHRHRRKNICPFMAIGHWLRPPRASKA